jgi:hypothetical protein
VRPQRAPVVILCAGRRSGKRSRMTGDFNRPIVSRGHDDRGEFVILDCNHKVRRRGAKPNPDETHRWCSICANRSPYRHA